MGGAQYSVMRNYVYMGHTEFETLPADCDWELLDAYGERLSFVFGLDDHWGPLHHLEELQRRVPALATEVEREGHRHAFCCTLAGAVWNAEKVRDLCYRRDLRLAGTGGLQAPRH